VNELSLNAVSLDEVRAELDETEMTRLLNLRQWLLHGPDRPQFRIEEESEDEQLQKMHFRSAPSIVVRSEAELFGINKPRFAYRARLSGTDGSILGFSNLRRIKSFVRSIGKRLDVGIQADFLTKLQLKCRCLADSFLAVPNWAGAYQVVTTDLARWYAESGPDNGTSFVTHFPVGGGMCAQAVCFMASALLHDYANGVFGVAEVTMLSSEFNDESIKFLDLA
jgi:hypothetical protein